MSHCEKCAMLNRQAKLQLLIWVLGKYRGIGVVQMEVLSVGRGENRSGRRTSVRIISG